MSSNRIRKGIILTVTFIGVVINCVYGIELLKEFFAQQNNEIREVLISAIALEFGWATMLIWVVFKPFERRHILLITSIPMLLGNILHSINQAIYFNADAGAIAVNIIAGLVIAQLFVFAYFIGKPGEL